VAPLLCRRGWYRALFLYTSAVFNVLGVLATTELNWRTPENQSTAEKHRQRSRGDVPLGVLATDGD
jgi:hypothetical protein